MSLGAIYDGPALRKDYDAITAAIASGWTVPWRQDLYEVWLPVPALYGSMAHNEPIDVIHWTAGPGIIGESGMDWWQQCLTLFMRHI